MAKDADKFKADMAKARMDERGATSKVEKKKVEGQKLVDKELLSLLRALVKDDKLSSTIGLVKNKRHKQWVFEIAFKESDMINREDTKETLADVSKIVVVADLSNPVSEVTT